MATMHKSSRRSRGSLTIEDVAREAGVSAMTVSRVINKEKNVREQTRQTVLETIERLNYSPNSAARNLAAGETTHIGLLYSNPSAAYSDRSESYTQKRPCAPLRLASGVKHSPLR